MSGRFACAANCIDGRVQEAVTTYLREAYGVDWVDMVTEPGINLILARDTDTEVVFNIMRRIRTSVQGHGSRVVAIVGHPDCKGNPAEKSEQTEHLRRAKATTQQYDFHADITIVLLWVNDDWRTVEVIDPT